MLSNAARFAVLGFDLMSIHLKGTHSLRFDTALHYHQVPCASNRARAVDSAVSDDGLAENRHRRKRVLSEYDFLRHFSSIRDESNGKKSIAFKVAG
jgi:hypothetical protein